MACSGVHQWGDYMRSLPVDVTSLHVGNHELAGVWSLLAQHVLTPLKQAQSHDFSLKFGVNYMQSISTLTLKSHSFRTLPGVGYFYGPLRAEVPPSLAGACVP